MIGLPVAVSEALTAQLLLPGEYSGAPSARVDLHPASLGSGEQIGRGKSP